MPEDTPQTFYLTTPIYYVNARPHIGTAYTTLVADVLARRHRLLGHDTFFLTGTDEHGQKIQRSAAAAGIPPQQFTDEVSAHFRALWDRMGLTYDKFIRTTSPAHKRGAQQLFRTLYERGHIYLSSYTGQYSVGEEMFVDGPPGTLGPDGKPTETVTEENFFFRLSEFQLPLLDLIEPPADASEPSLEITPETARNEVLSFLKGNIVAALTQFQDDTGGIYKAKDLTSEEIDREIQAAVRLGYLARSSARKLYVPGALKDLSISRSSFTWGIPVPEDIQEAAGATQPHILYVWLDALANYITAVGYGSDDPADQAQFAKYWPADLHLVGKEITRFHCIYWPAFLLAAGLPLPKQVTAHGWLLFDNTKMSKSKGNIVRTETVLDAFGDHVYAKQFPDSTKHERDLFAADVLRYFLLREIPFGQDGSFTFDALLTRYNADLANGYGNLVSRTLSMVRQYLGGVIAVDNRADWTEVTWLDYAASKSELLKSVQSQTPTREFGMYQVIESITGCRDIFAGKYGDVGFQGQLGQLFLAIQITDRFLSQEEPWKVAKQPELHGWLEEILYTAAESIRIITLLLHPILPYTTLKVWGQLGLNPADLSTTSNRAPGTNHQPPSTLLQWGGLQPGTQLGPLSPIFPRADKSLIQVMTDMEESRNTDPRPEDPLKAATTPTAPSAAPKSSTDPAAAPRTSNPAADPTGPLPVAGSTAQKPTLPTTPGPHTTAPASGLFAPPQPPQPSTEHQAPGTEQITIDDFAKIDLRVAQIVLAERIPKADKLLRLEVDLGPTLGRRQILSGIAQHYTPEELVGRRIAVIANLAPRKMRGLDSHGMLLAASAPEDGPDAKPILATFPDEIPLGSRIR